MPVIVGVAGGIIAIPAMYLMPSFPASDIITAITDKIFLKPCQSRLFHICEIISTPIITPV
jgi:hypothetical protein